jgi:hypothetical protein
MNRNHVAVNGVGPTRVVTFTVPCEPTDFGTARVVLTPERALELACWIVFAVDPHETKFDEILRQIEDG